MSNRFKVEYEVEDGYVGGSAPQYMYINEIEIEDYLTEEDLRKLYQQEVQDDFVRKILPYGTNEDEFVEWAQGVIKAREE